MKVAELKKILETLEEDSDVLIEYTPRRHEYIAEHIFGVRAEENTVYILGVTDLI